LICSHRQIPATTSRSFAKLLHSPAYGGLDVGHGFHGGGGCVGRRWRGAWRAGIILETTGPGGSYYWTTWAKNMNLRLAFKTTIDDWGTVENRRTGVSQMTGRFSAAACLRAMAERTDTLPSYSHNHIYTHICIHIFCHPLDIHFLLMHHA
jgi:hypothetical protein